MKKVLVLAMMALVLVGCSKSAEDYAKERAVVCMKKYARDPSSVDVSDIKTIYASDSLCVLNFTLRAKNGFGGNSVHRIEYIYGIEKENRREVFYELGEKKSVVENAKKALRELEASGKVGDFTLEKVIPISAAFPLIGNGHVIDDE